jgi:hypothetical protein
VQPAFQTPDRKWSPAVSPDGHWLAWASSASGRLEVYVGPYPNAGAGEQVSLEGGHQPVWRRDGRELFFLSNRDPAGKARMMAIDVEAGSPPRFGRPRPLFEYDPQRTFYCSLYQCFDVAPDGQRFYTVELPALSPPPVVTHINLIQNWFGELKAKVPTTR